MNIELGELEEHLDGLSRDMPLVTVCASGVRSATAGSILQCAGGDNIQVVLGTGTLDWIEQGYPVATGEE